MRYREVYPGINVIYHSKDGELEYDFVVAPASDPSQIRFELRGADSVRMDKRGDLVVVVNASEVRWHKPVLYQMLGGANKKVAGDYVVKDTHRVAFKVAKYDKSKSLVIDPVLTYSSYLGGNGYENGWGVAVDPAGYAYVAGITLSSDFPTTPESFQPIFHGGIGDAFVTKVDPSGILRDTSWCPPPIDPRDLAVYDRPALWPMTVAVVARGDTTMSAVRPSIIPFAVPTEADISNACWSATFVASGPGSASVGAPTESIDAPSVYQNNGNRIFQVNPSAIRRSAGGATGGAALLMGQAGTQGLCVNYVRGQLNRR